MEHVEHALDVSRYEQMLRRLSHLQEDRQWTAQAHERIDTARARKDVLMHMRHKCSLKVQLRVVRWRL